MALTTVLARAWGGEPLQRLAIEEGQGVVYIAHPAYADAIEAGEAEPAGFPVEDIFEFDEAVFAVLADQWARQRATDPATWQKLKRYEIRKEPA